MIRYGMIQYDDITTVKDCRVPSLVCHVEPKQKIYEKWTQNKPVSMISPDKNIQLLDSALELLVRWEEDLQAWNIRFSSNHWK